ncbi:MAG TPA: Hpt domain-containing protein [Gammaproteobacteria bacterium]|nr:Hpt domain-containing protein [Gammaproteobacteria bacterium]
MNQAIDFSTLNWVKQELDATLKEARQALEAHVEDPRDESQLKICGDALHQVHGTLEMVEIYGAALLAEEMEKLVGDLLDAELTNREQAFELLMGAILQLPDYLERLTRGHRDVPLVLLPLLNDMRAARGRHLLSENAMFAPDLSRAVPDTVRTRAGERTEDARSLARRLRHHFQLGLLAWYRSKDVNQGLSGMRQVLDELLCTSDGDAAPRLWWVADGLIEALQQNLLESSVSTTLLLGQVDRQIKRLIDAGEGALQEQPDTELLKNLLFYVARAADGGDVVSAIKRHYRLDELLPSDSELEQARESLAGRNAELMRTVSGAVKENLSRVKDGLDVFLRGSREQTAELEPLIEGLGQIGDTLGMLGLGAVRRDVQDQLAVLQAMVGGEREVDDGALMEVAGALLSVESALDEMADDRPAGADSATGLQGQEYWQIRGVVAQEAMSDLARAKDAVMAFVDAECDFTLLEPVPQLLHQIKGGMLLLGEREAGALADALLRYVQEGLVDGQSPPDEEQMDLFADAVSSLEYYLEALGENRLFSASVLDVAARSMEQLGFAPRPPAPEDTDTAQAGDGEDGPGLPDEIVLESPADEERTGEEQWPQAPEADSGAEPDDPPAASGMDWDGASRDAAAEGGADEAANAAPDDVEDIVLSGLGDEDAPEDVEPVPAGEPASEAHPDTAPAQAPGPAPAGPSGLAEEVDEEILGIFIEEAEEELAVIQECMPQWVTDQENGDALSTMRRSFHTLKGSGRLVGAVDIGEFAWAFENMLNRVIDRTVMPGQTMFALLQQASDALVELIAQVKSGAPVTVNTKHLMDCADALSRGDSLAVDDLQVPADAPAPDRAAPEPAMDDAAGEPGTAVESGPENTDDEPMDPALYEIFRGETHGHTGTISEFVAECRAKDGRCWVTQNLVRALHTLHGSARMAGATDIAALAAELEKYAKALMAEQLPIPPEGAAALEESANVVEDIVFRLGQPDVHIPDCTELRAHVAGLPRTPEAMEAAEADEPGEDDVDLMPFADDVLLGEADAPMDPPAPGLEDPAQTLPAAPAVPEEDEPAARSPVGTDLQGPPEQTRDVAEDIAVVDGPEVSGPEVSGPEVSGPETPGPEAGGGEGSPSGAGPEDVDPELIEIFLEEGTEILEQAEQTLQQWVQNPDDPELMATLQRQLHTLKGGARMAGITPIGELSHSLETLLNQVVDGHVPASRRLSDLLQIAQDRLVQMLEQVREGQSPELAAGLVAELEGLRRGEGRAPEAAPDEDAPDGDAPAGEPAEPAVQAQAPVDDGSETVVDLSRWQEDRRSAPRVQQEQVRVRADLMDGLVNYAGEISIYRARLEQQAGALRFNLSELEQTVERVRDRMRKLEIETEAQILYRYEREATEVQQDFDPLEMDRYSQLQQLSRSLAEGVSDLSSIQALLSNNVRESETLLLQQSRVNTELQEGLMRTRMVPFAGLAPRLRRIVRQTAQELGKKAELVFGGVEGEMDRTVIDRIVAPLEHMLRNALSHGIESPQVRKAAGKPETGRIRISLDREASDVVIRIADDGRGMDLDAIREKAIQRGLVSADAELSEQDIMQFVLETGFSTAEEVTQIAGRGVGMDVVNSEVKQLGGALLIDTKPGQGSTFTVRLPFTLAINQALLVQVGEDNYAIPLSSIEGIVRMAGAELERYLRDDGVYDYAGHSYQVRTLAGMLGVPGGAQTLPKRAPVLLVHSGDHRVALQVDTLLGSREVVVKSVGPQISTVRGISGATILGDGRVVLILDLGALIRAGELSALTEPVTAPTAPREERRTTVMVVDDSITVRKITARLLERNEMDVITAKDGVDAVAKLQEHIPDVMLLDIEMPRMDGFELATHVRNEERLRDIPMVMITSRTGDKHRKRAEEIGVDRYLGKPYQESDLLENIERVIEERRGDG